MKVATLDLSAELFVEFAKLCKGGPPRKFIVKENPLPADAKILHVGLANRFVYPPLTLRLFIQSESFEDVPAGQIPPELPNIAFETLYNEVSELAA